MLGILKSPIFHLLDAASMVCIKLGRPCTYLLRHKIGGSSAGAMCALALLCDIPLVSGRPHQEPCNALPEG